MYKFKKDTFRILLNKQTVNWVAAISNNGMVGNWPEPGAIEKGFFDLLKDKQAAIYSKWDSTSRVGVPKTPVRTFCNISVNLLREKLKTYNSKDVRTVEALFSEMRAYVDQARLNKAFTSMHGISIDYKNDNSSIRKNEDTALDLKILLRSISLLEQILPSSSERFSMLEEDQGIDPTLSFLSSLVNAGVLDLVKLSTGQGSGNLVEYKSKTAAYLVFDLLTSDTYEALIAPSQSEYDTYQKTVEVYEKTVETNSKLDPKPRISSELTNDFLSALFHVRIKDEMSSYVSKGAFPDGIVIIEVPGETLFNQNNYMDKMIVHSTSERQMSIATFKRFLFGSSNVPYFMDSIDFSDYVNKNEIFLPQRKDDELSFEDWLNDSKFRSLILDNRRKQASLRSPLYSFSIVTETADLLYNLTPFAINREFKFKVDYKVGNSKDHTEDESITQYSVDIAKDDLKDLVAKSLEHYNEYVENYNENLNVSPNDRAMIIRDILTRFRQKASAHLIDMRVDDSLRREYEKIISQADKFRRKVKSVYDIGGSGKIVSITDTNDEVQAMSILREFVLQFSRNSMTSKGIIYMLFAIHNMSTQKNAKLIDISEATTAFELVFDDINELVLEYNKHNSGAGNTYLESSIDPMLLVCSENLIEKFLHIISIDEVYGDRLDRTMTIRPDDSLMKPSINYLKWDRLDNNVSHLTNVKNKD